MTQSRFSPSPWQLQHAGTSPRAQRETCTHRLAGDVRLAAASAMRPGGNTGIGLGRSDNEIRRGRTGV
jgi:hypothetical protein